MKKIFYGMTLLLVGIAFLVVVRLFLSSSVFYEKRSIQLLDRGNYLMLPYPIILQDGSTVVLLRGGDLNVSDSGGIIFNPAQAKAWLGVKSFEKHYENLDGWGQALLSVKTDDVTKKKAILALKSKLTVMYEISDNGIKICDAFRYEMNLARSLLLFLLPLIIVFASILLIVSGVSSLRKHSGWFDHLTPPQ